MRQLLLLLVFASLGVAVKNVTCAINGPSFYWPGNGCYPGPEENSRLPNSIMFREQFGEYHVYYVCPTLGHHVCKTAADQFGCYPLAEHDVEHPCTCTSKSAPSIMMSEEYYKLWAASYSGECGKEQHRLEGVGSLELRRPKTVYCDVTGGPYHPGWGTCKKSMTRPALDQMTSNEADWGIAFREDITQKDGSMAIVTYVCERDAVFCSEGADGTSPWTATAPGQLGDKMGCWKNVKKPTPYSSGICENLDDAATTGLWPQLAYPVSRDFKRLIDSRDGRLGYGVLFPRGPNDYKEFQPFYADIVCSITARPWHPEHKCSAMQFEPRRTNDQIAFYENVLDTDGYGWTRIAYACGPLHSFCGGPKTPPEIEPGCWAGVARPYSSAECSYYGMISSMKAPMSISLKMLLEYYDKEGKLALGEQRVFTRPANFTYPELWTTTTTTTTPTTTTPSTPSTPSWSRPEYIGPPTYPPVVYLVHDDYDHVDDDESPVGTLIAICVSLLLCCCAIFCICKCCWAITCDVISKPWHPDHGGCVEVKREIGIEDLGIAFHENVTNKDGGWTYVTYACRESPYPDAVIFCGGPPAPPRRAVPKTPGCWSRTLRDDPQHSAVCEADDGPQTWRPQGQSGTSSYPRQQQPPMMQQQPQMTYPMPNPNDVGSDEVNTFSEITQYYGLQMLKSPMPLRNTQFCQDRGTKIWSATTPYVIEKLLGEGGFGADKVHVAGDPSLTYAMKIEQRRRPGKELKLKMELKILLAAGDSDRRCLHFTKLIDRGSRPEFVFMVMELVGKSVKDVQRERRGKVFTISTACQVAEQTLEALEDMHALRISIATSSRPT
ncbi:unnamed protein product, partial [Mesorhabditis spiculigera]